MKFNTKLPVLNLEKDPLKESHAQDAKELLFRTVFVNALLSDEKTVEQNRELKVKKFGLAERIQDSQEDVSLTTDEVVLIKECVNKIYPTIIVGRVESFFEGPKESLN